MLDDDLPTSTSTQQTALERKILPFYQELDSLDVADVTEILQLLRSAHISYMQSGLGKLPSGFVSLDASRPWITYWIVHSLALLGGSIPDPPGSAAVVEFLKHCQSPTGGFGGGPMQMAHLAPTYAAVCALVTIGGEAALNSIDRASMQDFLRRMCVPPELGGGFRIHDGGEADLRSCYTAMAVAHLLCLDKEELVQRSGMAEYIKRAQTYEGGLGGEPFNEAHGGYAFCGLAAMALAGRAHELDLPRLTRWAAQRQGACEGGFNGRTNKLVDGCYSFWQGGLFPILQRVAPEALRQSTDAVRAVSAAAAASAAAGQPAAGAQQQQQQQPYGLEGGVQVPVVPPLPHGLIARTPIEQAALVMQEKQTEAQQLINTALSASDEADAAMATGTERSTKPISDAARELLNQASTAQMAAEAANANINIANSSAAVMYPVPDPSDPPLPSLSVQGMASTHLEPPAFNYKALQLWILRCCQQAKGGLKDKPGKPADYYHTCYCLSGLSQAQHCSNAVLGPRDNLLRKADPMCNVVEDKVEAARRYYAQKPIAAFPEDVTNEQWAARAAAAAATAWTPCDTTIGQATHSFAADARKSG